MNLAAIFALLAGGLGLALVLTVWRGHVAARRGALLAGWSLVIASVPLWSLASGVEFGPFFALFAVAPFAWACVVWQSGRRTRHVVRPYVHGPRLPAARVLLRQLAVLIGAVPLAAAAASLAGLHGSTLLPVNVVDRMAIGVLAMPVLWGLFAWWVCIDSRPLRPLGTLTLLTAAGALLV